MSKTTSFEVSGKHITMSDIPTQLPGISVGDLMSVRCFGLEETFMYRSTVRPEVEKERVAWWMKQPLDEVKLGARMHGVRIQAKKTMVLELALQSCLPKDPATAPPPSSSHSGGMSPAARVKAKGKAQMPLAATIAKTKKENKSKTKKCVRFSSRIEMI
jgi:hypothetical protein